MMLTKLFEPGKIGKLEVRNRIVMPAIGTMAADAAGFISDRTIDYYEARAKGGVGLIISQGTSILREGRGPHFACIYDDKFIPRLRQLTDAVHRHGAKMALQLHHSGKVLFKLRQFFDDSSEGNELDVIGPSAVPWVWNGLATREMSLGDIEHVEEAFAEAARRGRDAGFDAVEFHGGHGYLMSSFLSPRTNQRGDKYGGSWENRARFVCEIIARARRKVGPDFPLILRVSGSDYLHGGITIEDTMRQAPLFVAAGANALHISASSQETTEWQFLSYLWPDGAIVNLAEAVKKVVNVPVITVGKIGDPVLAESILQSGKADFVAMGRALLADPDLPNKAREGRFDDICRCIYCNKCFSISYGEKIKFGGLFCTVNPALSREKEFVLKPAASPKKVMVVGGGLSGMEAASVLAERGHSVSLYEKGGALGGQWLIAAQEAAKKAFARGLLERMNRRVRAAGVKVVLHKEVTAKLVKEARPDAMVIATGATPKNLDVPGIDGKNVVQATDVLTGEAKVGQRVVVVGGRLVGMEVADHLAAQGKMVSLVTLHKLGENGAPVELEIYRTLRDRLINQGVHIYADTPLLEVMDNGVYVAYNRDIVFLAADTVVLAVGMKSEAGLIEEVKGIMPETYTIGDCVSPRDALYAIREGAEVGRKI